MAEWILQWMQWTVDLIKECLKPDASWFTFTTFGSTNAWNSITKGVAVLYDYFGIFAMGLALIYFVAELNQKVALEGRDMNMKSFFAPFLKLVVAVGIISQSGRIASLIITFSDATIVMIDRWGVNNSTHYNQLLTGLGEFSTGVEITLGTLGFVYAVLLFVIMIILFLLGNVLKLVWGYKSVMYKIEFLFRLSLFPIGIADIYNGNHSTAVRYVKAFLAHGIYGVSMIFIPVVACDIAFAMLFTGGWGWDSANILSMLTSFGTFFLAPFASLAAVSTAKQVAREALGC